jgi:hypothetical protein
MSLFFCAFVDGAGKTTDVSSVAHFRLVANAGGWLQKLRQRRVIDAKS